MREVVALDVFEVRVSETPGEQQPLRVVHNVIWKALQEAARYYRCDETWALLDMEPAVQASVDGDSTRLSFELPGRVYLETVRVLFAATRADIESEVSQQGWFIVAPCDPRAQVVDQAREVLEGTSLLSMVEPSASFIDGLLGNLDSGNPQAVQTVVWYLGNTARPPLHAIERLIAFACQNPEFVGPVRRTVGRLAMLVEMTPLVEAHLTSADPVARALVLEMLPGEVERGAMTRAELLEHLLGALELGAVAAQVSVGMLGANIPPGDLKALRRVYEALVSFLDTGVQGEARHDAVLSLVNMFLNKSAVPVGLVSVFEAHLNAPGTLAGLAQWAVGVFGSRPETNRWDELV